jgi:hypothetical protein
MLSISCTALGCAWLTAASYAATPPQDAPEATYSDKETGLSFSYPSSATIEHNPDKDTIVKFTGSLSTGGQPGQAEFFVVTINRNELTAGSDPGAAVKALDERFFTQLQNYRLVNNERKWIGKHSQFDADIRTFSHEMGGIRVRQKWIIFKDPQAKNRLGMMTFITPERDSADLDRLTSRLLATLDHPSANTATSVSAQPLRRSTFDGITIAYPGEWTSLSNPDRDTLLKLQSGNLEMRVGSMPTEMNIGLDQMQKILDDEILSKLPRYKKLSDTTRRYGTGAAGVKETFSGESEGMPAFGQAFFFPYSNKLYCLIMISWGMDQSEAVKRFDAVLSSMVMH